MNKGIPFKWWISLGRYGLAFLSKLTTVGIDLNVTLTNVITYLLLFTSSVILSFIIWRSENKINSFWVVIAAGLYLTSPTMLEQTNFVLQSMEVTFAFNLLYIAILFIQYFIETKHKLFFALAIISTIIAFSIYTSLQAAFVVVTLLALYLHSDSNSYFSYIKNAVPYVIVLVASTLFNIVATKAISKALNIPKNNY
ncbi:glucosyltransferase domain-containing protein, partial [Latilactobacillus curvatus]